MDSGLNTGNHSETAPELETMGRLAQHADPSYVTLYEAPHMDREKRQFPFFITVDLAHAVMLTEQRILTAGQTAKLIAALEKLQGLGVNALDLDIRHGSMLFQIERFLFAEVGDDLGGRLHTGRSRLDQGPTVRRLYKRDMLIGVLDDILKLREALITKAAQFPDAIMPGYTCLQHAHPAVFGHYLLSFVSKLEDDFDRLVSAYGRLNRSPLGGAGLSGTSWPIDRQRTAELLGFDGLVKNSKLVREAYYAAEVAGGLAMLMSTLNDIATDFHLWSSYEFGLVELADQFCGTSSIFPQKKNPMALEAVKAVAGEAISWPSIILTTFRAEGTGDVGMREAQIIDRALTQSRDSLRVMTPVIETMDVKTARMKHLASANWSTATDLADALVRERGVSFRTAHAVVARFIRLSLDRGHTVETANGALLDEAARDLGVPEPHFTDKSVREAFDVDAFRLSRTSEGSINPGEIDILLAEATAELTASRAWLETAKSGLRTADQKLQTAIDRIVREGGG